MIFFSGLGTRLGRTRIFLIWEGSRAESGHIRFESYGFYSNRASFDSASWIFSRLAMAYCGTASVTPLPRRTDSSCQRSRIRKACGLHS